MILDSLKSLLISDPAFETLASTRAYDTVFPRGTPMLPAVVYHVAAKHTDYTFAGPSNLNDITVQFDVYAEKAPEVRALHDAVVKILSGYVGELQDGGYINGAFLVTEGDKPYVPAVNKTAIGFLIMLQVRVVYGDVA